MPLYDYACNNKDCGVEEAYIQRYEEAPLPCKKCGGDTRRVIRGFPALSIMLKSEGGVTVGDRAREIERRQRLEPGSLVPTAVDINRENRGLDESRHEAITAAKKAGYSEKEYDAAMASAKTTGVNTLHGKLPTKE